MISKTYAKNFNAIDKFNEYVFSTQKFYYNILISILSYLYRHDYPHRYSCWQSCLIFNVLYSGVINAWSAYATSLGNKAPTLETFMEGCISALLFNQ